MCSLTLSTRAVVKQTMFSFYIWSISPGTYSDLPALVLLEMIFFARLFELLVPRSGITNLVDRPFAGTPHWQDAYKWLHTQG